MVDEGTLQLSDTWLENHEVTIDDILVYIESTALSEEVNPKLIPDSDNTTLPNRLATLIAESGILRAIKLSKLETSLNLPIQKLADDPNLSSDASPYRSQGKFQVPFTPN